MIILQSPHHVPSSHRKMWIMQLWEELWQVLAIWELCVQGFGRPAIIAVIAALLVGSCSNLIVGYITHPQQQRDRMVLAQVTRRLLLVDAACDLV